MKLQPPIISLEQSLSMTPLQAGAMNRNPVTGDILKLGKRGDVLQQ